MGFLGVVWEVRLFPVKACVVGHYWYTTGNSIAGAENTFFARKIIPERRYKIFARYRVGDNAAGAAAWRCC